MTTFFTTIGEAVTGIIDVLGDVTSALMTNELFLLGFGIMLFTTIVGIVSRLVKRGRGR